MSDTEVVEEHDLLVHVDFDTRIDDECLENLKQFKLIGIETSEPILQIGDQVCFRFYDVDIHRTNCVIISFSLFLFLIR